MTRGTAPRKRPLNPSWLNCDERRVEALSSVMKNNGTLDALCKQYLQPKRGSAMHYGSCYHQAAVSLTWWRQEISPSRNNSVLCTKDLWRFIIHLDTTRPQGAVIKAARPPDKPPQSKAFVFSKSGVMEEHYTHRGIGRQKEAIPFESCTWAMYDWSFS